MIRPILLLSFLIAFANTAGLPPFIKPCKMDNKIDECTMKNGQAAIPFLLKGDPKYRIPPFEPLQITELKVIDDGSKNIGMNITMRNIKIFGLKNAKLVKSNTDLQKKHIEWHLTTPLLNIEGDFKIAGKFLILPITGSGPGTIKLNDVKLTFSLDYKLEKKNGIEYGVITKAHLKYTPKDLTISLKNLFNGDKTLSKNMLIFMNENWKELNDTVGPSIAQAITLFVKQVLDEILKTVPYKDIFIK